MKLRDLKVGQRATVVVERFSSGYKLEGMSHQGAYTFENGEPDIVEVVPDEPKVGDKYRWNSEPRIVYTLQAIVGGYGGFQRDGDISAPFFSRLNLKEWVKI